MSTLLLAIKLSAFQSLMSPSIVMVDGVVLATKPPIVEVMKRSDKTTALFRMA